MKEGGQSALLPKLRFPEFRNAKGWDSSTLQEVAEFVSEKIPVDRIELANYISTENVLADYGGAATATKMPLTGSVTKFRSTDTLVSNIRPYLKKVWFSDRDGGASNDVIVIRAKKVLLTQYLQCLLRNDSFIRYVMSGAKGVKMPRGDVGSMKEYPTSYPTQVEQQKIADCLSSVDELIAVQGRKVRALKTRKDGLMKQLFPREGEAKPRLRFTEFRDEGVWINLTAGKLFTNRVKRGNSSLPIYSVTMTDGLIPRSSLERRVDDLPKASANKAASKGDIAYNMMRMWQGALGVAREDCMVSPAYIVLTPQGVNPYFFAFLLKLPQTLQVLTAHSRGLTEDRLRLYYDDFAKVRLSCPSLPEQNRIADCLVSLDDLIATETKNLDALKSHKEGLMQQLFPSAAGVEL